jgi:hypothetical protein
MASTKAAMNLPGAPSSWNNLSPARLYGLTAGTGSKAAGHTLPATSHQAGDRGAVWWSPDSPQFWLAVFIGGAFFGITGLSFRFRAGPAKAGASLGKS